MMQLNIFSVAENVLSEQKPFVFKLKRDPCNKCREGEYRTVEELNYFGSDLNKFVNNECSKDMTTINVDCLQYKRDKKTLRVIESKHNNERMKFAQKEALKVLAWAFSLLNSIQNEYKFECYIVSADHPYSEAAAHDLITGEVVRFTDKDGFKAFMEFNYIKQKGDEF